MIEIKKFVKFFGDKKVLNEVSFELKKGRIYGLLGNNGEGKTTLSKIIFQEMSLDSGELFYQGMNSNKIDYSTWYFFSENSELPKAVSVYTYLYLIKNFIKINSTEFNNRVSEILKFINIKGLFKNKISELSSGQQKLLSLFICFLIKPKVIFFDEPTANLDFENKKKILEAIKKLIKSDTTIVVITHLVEEVRDILNHIIIIDSGKITYDQQLGPKDNIQKIYKRFTTVNERNTKEIENYLNEK